MGRGSKRVATCEPRREASEETKPASSLILDFPPPELQAINFHFLKPPTLWDFLLQQLQKTSTHGPVSLCITFVSLFPNRCVYLKY